MKRSPAQGSRPTPGSPIGQAGWPTRLSWPRPSRRGCRRSPPMRRCSSTWARTGAPPGPSSTSARRPRFTPGTGSGGHHHRRRSPAGAARRPRVPGPLRSPAQPGLRRHAGPRARPTHRRGADRTPRLRHRRNRPAPGRRHRAVVSTEASRWSGEPVPDRPVSRCGTSLMRHRRLTRSLTPPEQLLAGAQSREPDGPLLTYQHPLPPIPVHCSEDDERTPRLILLVTPAETSVRSAHPRSPVLGRLDQ